MEKNDYIPPLTVVFSITEIIPILASSGLTSTLDDLNEGEGF